jgi:hypothetical protein
MTHGQTLLSMPAPQSCSPNRCRNSLRKAIGRAFLGFSSLIEGMRYQSGIHLVAITISRRSSSMRPAAEFTARDEA